MAASSKGLSIGEVSKRAHLSTHTIRAWERRYQVVEPTRSDGGTRRYTQADVERLKLLKAAVEAGKRISDIYRLSDVELGALACAPTRDDGAEDIVAAAHAGIVDTDQVAVDEVINSALILDALGVERHLNVQFRVLGSSAFRQHFCPALLFRIGHMWQNGNFPIASEHLVSEILTRILMRAIDRQPSSPNAPTIIFTTPHGEHHRLGLLIAAGVASDMGAHVVYLGANTPVDALALAVHHIKPAAVALSVVHLAPGTQREYFSDLRARVPGHVEVWIGGAGAEKPADGCSRLDLFGMHTRIRQLETHGAC